MIRARSLERILILVTADPSSAMLIRRGKRVADYLHADCFAVAVQRRPGRRGSSLRTARCGGAPFEFRAQLCTSKRACWAGDDAAKTLVEFARLNGVTQFSWPGQPRHWPAQFGGRNLVQQVVRLARDMQVIIVADRSKQQAH